MTKILGIISITFKSFLIILFGFVVEALAIQIFIVLMLYLFVFVVDSVRMGSVPYVFNRLKHFIKGEYDNLDEESDRESAYVYLKINKILGINSYLGIAYGFLGVCFACTSLL